MERILKGSQIRKWTRNECKGMKESWRGNRKEGENNMKRKGTVWMEESEEVGREGEVKGEEDGMKRERVRRRLHNL
jgi:hypothetical protein